MAKLAQYCVSSALSAPDAPTHRHGPPDMLGAMKSSNDGAPTSTRAKAVCKYFASGRCLQGKSCRFRHPDEAAIGMHIYICKYMRTPILRSCSTNIGLHIYTPTRGHANRQNDVYMAMRVCIHEQHMHIHAYM